MKARKKRKGSAKRELTESTPSPRNRAVYIPLDFEQAVEGLLNVKAKKKRSKK